MAGEQQQSWLSSAAAAAIATVVVLGASAFAVVNWGLPKAQSYLNTRFAALNAKLAQNNKDALSAIKKLPSLDAAIKEIEQLNSKVQTTNATLGDIQKQISLAAIKGELAPLNAKLDKAVAALAALQADVARAGSARDANATTRDAALARIEKAIGGVKDEASALTRIETAIGSVKDQIAGAASQAKLQDAAAKLDAVQTSLAEIEKAADTLKAGVSANAAALADAHKSLAGLEAAVKQGFAGGASGRAALKGEVAKLAQPAETPTGAIPKKTDVVVFYVSAPARAQEQTQAGAIPPMSVQFEKVGSADDNGQAALIIKKLRPIIAKHKSCSIAVSGHTDTVGSDAVNHALSKKRALDIAAKLKAAFAGQAIQISTIAWGERKLKEWTDDDTPDATNRRVDIVVHCAGA